MTREEQQEFLGTYTVEISIGIANAYRTEEFTLNEDMITLDMTIEEAIELKDEIIDSIVNEIVEVAVFKGDDDE